MAPSAVADVRMVMWNADGSRGAMCGNGLRCLAKLARDRGVIQSDEAVIETDAGLREVELIFGDGGEVLSVSVDMGDVKVEEQPETVELQQRSWEFYAADAGNPHAVVFVDEDPEDVPVVEVGAP